MLKTTIAAAALAAAVLAAVAVPADATRFDQTAVALRWYDQTAAAVKASGFTTQPTNSRIWAVSWLAAATAVGREPDEVYATAALASALHDSLVSLVPARTAQLDDELAASLAALPDGDEKSRGAGAGRDAAAAVLALRQQDGLDQASLNVAWTPPPAAPGIWRPTPAAFGPAVQAGQPNATPFLLGRNDRFLPASPPALDSEQYLTALAEVRDVGSATSTVRTDEQTKVARFWAQSSLNAFTGVVRAVVAADPRPLAWKVRVVAAFHAITIDAQLAVYQAKYVYTRWRPVTAIRAGGDPQWTPLVNTPSHPEYPAGHSGYAGAAEIVLESLVGPQPRSPIAIGSTTSPETRTYAEWRTLTQENIDGRVWEGVHFRFSDEIGAAIGAKVARYDLARLARLGL
jgi:hypothetical protein